jgi:hypothetical protein
VTTNEFRRLALSFPEAVESAHMSHPDFRVSRKIFATLGYPNKGCAVVKLPLVEQKRLIRGAPDVFQPAKGAWGRQGNTVVFLPIAKIDIVREALTLAWQSPAPKRLRENR